MSYENKEYILQLFEGVHEEENKAELNEVYRKAQAWDELKREVKTRLEISSEREDDFDEGMRMAYDIVIKSIESYESGDNNG